MMLSVSSVTYLGNEEKLPIDKLAFTASRSLLDFNRAISTSIATTCLQRCDEQAARCETFKSWQCGASLVKRGRVHALTSEQRYRRVVLSYEDKKARELKTNQIAFEVVCSTQWSHPRTKQ